MEVDGASFRLIEDFVGGDPDTEVDVRWCCESRWRWRCGDEWARTVSYAYAGKEFVHAFAQDAEVGVSDLFAVHCGGAGCWSLASVKAGDIAVTFEEVESYLSPFGLICA